MQNIIVSVCCLTYNQEKFIAEALSSILMQRVSFPFEVVVHDDASTDGTADIVRQYALDFPEIVRPIYQTENQFSKAGIYPLALVYPHIRGKYIALCDGDDYWTDPLKLQKQADFMEANPEYVLCHHAYQVLNDGVFHSPPRSQSPRDYSMDELVAYTEDGYGILNSAKMYKNLYAEHKKDFEDFVGDYPLNVMLGMYGPCKFIPDIAPSVYRRNHGSNSWAGLPTNEKILRTRAMRKKLYELMLERGNDHCARIREKLL